MKSEVKIGQVWRACDKRSEDRQCRVVDVVDDKAVLKRVDGQFPPTKVALRRMYPHSTGWELISDSV